MKNLTIGKRIVTGFAVVVVIFAGLGAFAVKQLRTISRLATETTADGLQGLASIGDIKSLAQENNVWLLKDLLTKNEDLWSQFEAQMQTNLQQMAGLAGQYQKTQKTAESQALFAKFDLARSQYETSVRQVLEQVRNGKNQAAMEMKLVKVDPFIAIIQAEGRRNKENGDLALAQVSSASTTMQASMLIGFGVMLLVCVVIAIAITLSIDRALDKIVQDLDTGYKQVAAASSQVSTASQLLAEGSSQQAAAIEETSASLEEMSSVTKRNAENAQKANDLAKQARLAADKGVGDMQAMNTAMDAIKTSSDDIAKIIKTIDEIAFQTNILALNAAVEAARAGEAGMGFAVVADEVRNLAQRSAQAAKETATKIEGAISKTGQGMGISKQVAETLNEIVTKARQVDELAAEVAGACREQTQGISQINTAVGQMDQVTQSNAANAEESAAAAQELKAQAENMKKSVAELLLLVGSGETGETGTTAPPVRTNESRRSAPVHKPRRDLAVRATPRASNGRHEVPLEGNFNDF